MILLLVRLLLLRLHYMTRFDRLSRSLCLGFHRFDGCAFPVKVLRERFGELKCQLLDDVLDPFLWSLNFDILSKFVLRRTLSPDKVVSVR